MNDPLAHRTEPTTRMPWADRHPLLIDAMVAALFLATIIGSTIIDLAYSRLEVRDVVERGALTIVVVTAIRCRRASPGIILAVAVGAQGAGFLLGQVGEPWSAVVLVCSAAARHRAADGARVAIAVIVTVILGLVATRVGWPTDLARARQFAAEPILYVVGTSCALAVGAIMGARRRYIAEILQRTRELAEERDRSAALARVAERARIARDMHDVLSHGLQVIVSAGDSALVTLESDRVRTRRLLTTVVDTGRQSMAEARLVFSLLQRDGDEDRRPQPDLDDLPGVIERLRSSGLVVTMEQNGTPPGDVPRRSTVVRIVQEALTNSLRHAGPGTQADVTITHGGGLTVVEVLDNGARPVDSPTTSHDGRRIDGMRQRAGLFRGVVSAGWREDTAGWSLRAVLPHGEPGGEAS